MEIINEGEFVARDIPAAIRRRFATFCVVELAVREPVEEAVGPDNVESLVQRDPTREEVYLGTAELDCPLSKYLVRRQGEGRRSADGYETQVFHLLSCR